MFKIEGFQLPQPVGEGFTVRNTHAFQLLLNIFNKVNTIFFFFFKIDSNLISI
jgi:hypothetical protein